MYSPKDPLQLSPLNIDSSIFTAPTNIDTKDKLSLVILTHRLDLSELVASLLCRIFYPGQVEEHSSSHQLQMSMTKVVLEEERIESLLQELYDNAVKYPWPGGILPKNQHWLVDVGMAEVKLSSQG